MKNKPLLFLYCQHSLGMGHLRRSIEIAKALLKDFRVVFINGGRIPESIPRPAGIDFIDLPPLGMNENSNLISHTQGLDVNQAKKVRRLMIQEQFQRLQPDVLLVELFPFGRKKFAFELLPLLRLAKRSQAKPLVLCDLRDILVNDRWDQQRHDDRAHWLCKRYFDAILIHTDPKFASLEESFHPRKILTTPVYYTGFVTGESTNKVRCEQSPGVVVSAGGGNVGGTLFRTAIAAQPQIWQRYKIPMTLVAGPFLPAAEWDLLQQQAQNKPGLLLHRSVPDLQGLLQLATVSVSQCGYNTAMDLLKTKIPALLVPYAEGRENEQTIRAIKLKNLDMARVLAATALNPDSFFREIGQLLVFSPAPIALLMDGAEQSAAIILKLLNELTDQHGNQQYAKLA
jgi:predicted glycosyltransferase